MFEKVNPSHPDKIADRIAGAMVDLAYANQERPLVAIEVLIGHGICHVIAESSYAFSRSEVGGIVIRIAGNMALDLKVVKQDGILAGNQRDGIRCGDNGIFRGVPTNTEEGALTELAREIYGKYPSDGKYIADAGSGKLVICQSNADEEELRRFICADGMDVSINPLGYWTGGTDVDTGATNRKLGSDMGRAVTGGGLHGKDLSKADVTLNIYAHMKAEKTGNPVDLCCAIGDGSVDGIPYQQLVNIAGRYVADVGGFEKLAEWGLIR